MGSSESSEVQLSQHDLPLWARGASVGLLLFATWWLLDTEAIRDIIGASTGLLSLGVISIFILQGMHLPLGMWSTGPWRSRFSVPAVIAVGIVIAAVLLVSRAREADALGAYLDVGMGVAVVAGTVALGFSLAYVRQRPYLGWYAIALGLGALPVVGALLSVLGGEGGTGFPCLAMVDLAEQTDGRQTECVVGLVQALLFFVAIGIPSKLMTEEIAFRRLLIGSAAGAGIVGIVGSAAAASLWYAVLAWAGIASGPIVVLGAIGAVSAGCLYVLSRSMIVSATFSGVYAAGYWVVQVVEVSEGLDVSGALNTPNVWIPALVSALVLTLVVYRRNGVLGNLNPAHQVNAASN